MTDVAWAVRETAEWLLPSLPELDDDLRNVVVGHALDLVEDSRALIVDDQSTHHLGLYAVVLAAFGALTEHLGDAAKARRQLDDALVRAAEAGASAYVESRLGVRLDDPDSAFDRIAENFIARGRARFGSSFRYVDETRTDSLYIARIETCLFDRFLREKETAELTPLLCRLDIVWADELQRRCPSVAFTRPTTLAAGDDACRFQFACLPDERR
jgi:hypothetical protein